MRKIIIFYKLHLRHYPKGIKNLWYFILIYRYWHFSIILFLLDLSILDGSSWIFNINLKVCLLWIIRSISLMNLLLVNPILHVFHRQTCPKKYCRLSIDIFLFRWGGHLWKFLKNYLHYQMSIFRILIA